MSGINNVMSEIIGSEKDEPYYKWLARRLKIANHIVFRGYLPHGKVVDAFQRCDIFVHPAVYEAFGMVVLEAMACGKPVVVTNTCGSAELIKEERNGLLVPPDPEALFEAIWRLICDESLGCKLGKAAIQLIREKCSWDHVADEYFKVYSKTINYTLRR